MDTEIFVVKKDNIEVKKVSELFAENEMLKKQVADLKMMIEVFQESLDDSRATRYPQWFIEDFSKFLTGEEDTQVILKALEVFKTFRKYDPMDDFKSTGKPQF